MQRQCIFAMKEMPEVGEVFCSSYLPLEPPTVTVIEGPAATSMTVA